MAHTRAAKRVIGLSDDLALLLITCLLGALWMPIGIALITAALVPVIFIFLVVVAYLSLAQYLLAGCWAVAFALLLFAYRQANRWLERHGTVDKLKQLAKPKESHG